MARTQAGTDGLSEPGGAARANGAARTGGAARTDGAAQFAPPPSEREIFAAHEGGKLETHATAAINNREDLARVYTPGVARVCEAIHAEPELARRYTVKSNTVAVVTDGTAVLGLGDIGPLASLPVMEGKAALFKRFAGVDAWPVPLATTDTEEIIAAVRAIAPAYAGINLEDISAPRCFEIEKRLRAELDIPVFHDDQHGTAVVVLAALMTALRVVGKRPSDARVVVCGIGAAGTAIIRLLLEYGVRDIVAVDRSGTLGPFRSETNPGHAWVAARTNPRQIDGDVRGALRGANVFIGVSGPNILDGAALDTMADNAIVFALANPTPEIAPEIAREHAAVVATGRSDYPNQINNVLAFPGIFRGLLDAHATEVSDAMLLAAAQALADLVGEDAHPDYIIVSAFDERAAAAVAQAVRESVEES